MTKLNVDQKVNRIADIKHLMDNCKWFKSAMLRSGQFSMIDQRTGSHVECPITISDEANTKIKSILLEEVMKKASSTEKTYLKQLLSLFKNDSNYKEAVSQAVSDSLKSIFVTKRLYKKQSVVSSLISSCILRLNRMWTGQSMTPGSSFKPM